MEPSEPRWPVGCLSARPRADSGAAWAATCKALPGPATDPGSRFPCSRASMFLCSSLIFASSCHEEVSTCLCIARVASSCSRRRLTSRASVAAICCASPRSWAWKACLRSRLASICFSRLPRYSDSTTLGSLGLVHCDCCASGASTGIGTASPAANFAAMKAFASDVSRSRLRLAAMSTTTDGCDDGQASGPDSEACEAVCAARRLSFA
mmetsp:Transcript_2668/g.6994  ORF Transcript_2668/g.6994 Transcript_2668/m.6994 type:complete len:209 (-) Transcript_2668:480-1106(-)